MVPKWKFHFRRQKNLQVWLQMLMMTKFKRRLKNNPSHMVRINDTSYISYECCKPCGNTWMHESPWCSVALRDCHLRLSDQMQQNEQFLKRTITGDDKQIIYNNVEEKSKEVDSVYLAGLKQAPSAQSDVKFRLVLFPSVTIKYSNRQKAPGISQSEVCPLLSRQHQISCLFAHLVKIRTD